MNQAQRKPRQKPAPKIIRERQNKETLSNQDLDQEQLALSEFWKEEARALIGRHYHNLGQALEVLIERVLDRFSLPQEQRGEMREFLMLLFDTDQEIKEELSKILEID